MRNFADDTRLIMEINTIDDVSKLQDDVNSVTVWSNENNMFLHQKKFEVLHHRFNTDSQLLLELPFVAYQCSYKTSDDTIIQPSTVIRDLGVSISHDMS